MRSAQLVLGTAQLGMDYGRTNADGQPSETETFKILELAETSGIRSFDTARAYGNSEIRLGRYFTDSASNPEFFSKLMPLNAKEKISVHTIINAMSQSLERSLQALQTGSISVLMAHRLEDLLLFDQAGLEFLIQQRDKGKFTRLGISVLSPEELQQALTLEDIEHIQLPTNIIDHRWLKTISGVPKNISLHARSIFMQGLLLERSSYLWPYPEKFDPQPILQLIDRWVLEFERNSREDLCIAFVRSLKLFDGVIIGINRINELQNNIELFSQPLLTKHQLEKILQEMPLIPDSVLDPYRWPAIN